MFFSSAPAGQREKHLAFLSDSGSPQIPSESEGTRNRKNGRPLRFRRNLREPGPPKILWNFRGTRRFPLKSPPGAPSLLSLTETVRRANLTFVPRSPENRMRFSGNRGDRMDSRGRAFGELFFPSHKWLGEKHV